MAKEKKKWLRPQLVVLSKGKTEEAVLLACKWVWESKSGRNCSSSSNTCRARTNS